MYDFVKRVFEWFSYVFFGQIVSPTIRKKWQRRNTEGKLWKYVRIRKKNKRELDLSQVLFVISPLLSVHTLFKWIKLKLRGSRRKNRYSILAFHMSQVKIYFDSKFHNQYHPSRNFKPKPKFVPFLIYRLKGSNIKKRSQSHNFLA